MRGGLVLLVRSLDHGGAQTQIALLAKALHRKGVAVEVLTFYSGGALEKTLTDIGVSVASLEKSRRWDLLRLVFGFVRYVRNNRPAVVYSFLPEANLVALLARPALRSCRVAWGLRASNMVLEHYDWLLRLVHWTEARLSRFAEVIIANSEAGGTYAVKRGFNPGKLHVVTNGIDAKRFHFDRDGRQRLRAEWGVQHKEVVLGLAARLDPMKDHPAFLRAAARVASDCSNARFVCVGSGPEGYGERLRALAQELNIHDRMIWLGGRDDMPAVNSAFDIGCSTSAFGEGFPNAVAEGMACERPCIVTDVGDSAAIVGKTGWVVPLANDRVMAAAMTEAVRMDCGERMLIGRSARERIVSICSVDALCDRTLALLTPLGLGCAKLIPQKDSPSTN